MTEEAKNEGAEEVTQDAQPSSPTAEATPAPAEPEVAAEPVKDEPAAEDKKEEEAKPAKKEKQPERQDMTTLHERTIAAMSYFGFLAIVPFYLKKDSEFCRFHGKQGMLLAIIFFMAKLFTVIDLLMDIVLILQVFVMFRMGLAALSGRWKQMALFYDWSCQLEEALSLKTKEQEMEEVSHKPNETPKEPTK